MKETPTVEPSLSLLLDGEDIRVLQAAGLKPEDHTVLELQAQAVQISQQLPNGGYMLLIQVPTPPGMFLEPSKILAPNGVSARALDGVISAMPKVRCIVATERMVPAARSGIAKIITERLQAMGAGFSEPS